MFIPLINNIAISTLVSTTPTHFLKGTHLINFWKSHSFAPPINITGCRLPDAGSWRGDTGDAQFLFPCSSSTKQRK